MTLRERFADWITGGALTRRQEAYWRAREKEESTAAQRDEAIALAEVLTKQKQAIALDFLAAGGQAQEACEALRAILTARNITEARKIARDALGGE